MKKIFLCAFSLLFACFSIDGSQAKTKKETELSAVVCIKRVSEPNETMFSIAYTQGPYGYRIEEDLSLDDPVRLFVKSSLFKTEAGKRKPMYNLHACKEIPPVMYRFLTKAMNAAQKKAIGKYDHAWSTWQYQNGTVALQSSTPLPKTKESSDTESEQMVDDTNNDFVPSEGYES